MIRIGRPASGDNAVDWALTDWIHFQKFAVVKKELAVSALDTVLAEKNVANAKAVNKPNYFAIRAWNSFLEKK